MQLNEFSNVSLKVFLTYSMLKSSPRILYVTKYIIWCEIETRLKFKASSLHHTLQFLFVCVETLVVVFYNSVCAHQFAHKIVCISVCAQNRVHVSLRTKLWAHLLKLFYLSTLFSQHVICHVYIQVFKMFIVCGTSHFFDVVYYQFTVLSSKLVHIRCYHFLFSLSILYVFALRKIKTQKSYLCLLD